MKVVIDTNVVVSSAISSDGNPALIFEMLILEKIKNYTTLDIIEEVREVLQRPRIAKRLNRFQQEFILRAFEEFSERIEPAVEFSEIIEDPDDNKFLECAFSASAEYIISGDEHLLKRKEFRGIEIVSPAEFVQLMNKQKWQNIWNNIYHSKTWPWRTGSKNLSCLLDI